MAGACRGINTAAAGNSCLEYRADNWNPSVTGAMMMASTYRVLAGERPAADKRALVCRRTTLRSDRSCATWRAGFCLRPRCGSM
jgi:hypothetical protein